VARVKGKRVKALRRYLSEHAKTDLADAHVLAAIPGFGGPILDLVHIPAARSHALQRLTKQRGRMQDAVANAKRRLEPPCFRAFHSPSPSTLIPVLSISRCSGPFEPRYGMFTARVFWRRQR
jgi:hypothetical protein